MQFHKQETAILLDLEAQGWNPQERKSSGVDALIDLKGWGGSASPTSPPDVRGFDANASGT